jgi:hypothetical protein
MSHESNSCCRLSNDPVDVVGLYSGNTIAGAPARFTLPGDAFVVERFVSLTIQAERGNRMLSSVLCRTPYLHQFLAHGTLLNCNTIEDFRALDKNAFLSKIGDQVRAVVGLPNR